MAPWREPRKATWASNGNIAVYIFAVLLTIWVAFQVWDRLGGDPSPPALDAMVMASLGVAITAKGKEVDRKRDSDPKNEEDDS